MKLSSIKQTTAVENAKAHAKIAKIKLNAWIVSQVTISVYKIHAYSAKLGVRSAIRKVAFFLNPLIGWIMKI